MTDTIKVDADKIEAELLAALAAWTDDGRQPDGLNGNDAWEWAANDGVGACADGLALVYEVRRLRTALLAWRSARRGIPESATPLDDMRAAEQGLLAALEHL